MKLCRGPAAQSQMLCVQLDRMADAHGVVILRKDIFQLHHAGRTGGGHHGGAAFHDVIPFALTYAPGKIIMAQIERTAAAAAAVRLVHLHEAAGAGGLDERAGLAADPQSLGEVTGIMVGDGKRTFAVGWGLHLEHIHKKGGE